MLKNADWFLAVDSSASMTKNDTPSGKSRYADARESTLGLAVKLTELDPDGIDFAFFAGGVKAHNNVTPDKVEKLYAENEPVGSTNTHLVLQLAIDAHFERKAAGKMKENGTRIAVITDGDATNRQLCASVIIEATKKIDKDEELAIGFFQVGRDPEATEFLKYLDDELVKQGAKFDIVDTKNFEQVEAIGLTAALEAMVTD